MAFPDARLRQTVDDAGLSPDERNHTKAWHKLRRFGAWCDTAPHLRRRELREQVDIILELAFFAQHQTDGLTIHPGQELRALRGGQGFQVSGMLGTELPEHALALLGFGVVRLTRAQRLYLARAYKFAHMPDERLGRASQCAFQEPRGHTRQVEGQRRHFTNQRGLDISLAILQDGRPKILQFSEGRRLAPTDCEVEEKVEPGLVLRNSQGGSDPHTHEFFVDAAGGGLLGEADIQHPTDQLEGVVDQVGPVFQVVRLHDHQHAARILFAQLVTQDRGHGTLGHRCVPSGIILGEVRHVHPTVGAGVLRVTTPHTERVATGNIVAMTADQRSHGHLPGDSLAIAL